MIKKMVTKSSKKTQKADKSKRRSASVDYHDYLIKSLKSKKQAIAYLNAALEESLKSDEGSQGLFEVALGNVVEAQGDIAAIARKAKMKKKDLENLLSGKASLGAQNLPSILHAMGFKVTID